MRTGSCASMLKPSAPEAPTFTRFMPESVGPVFVPPPMLASPAVTPANAVMVISGFSGLIHEKNWQSGHEASRHRIFE
jgi:hypothetical protein